jgi:hypothetical protein
MDDDLLKRIKDALQRDGEDIQVNADSVGNNMEMISINRKPEGEPDWEVAENGEIVVDWKEKFAREEKEMYPPFSPGELVKAYTVVEADKDGLYRLHVDEDGRHADNFFISKINTPDPLRHHVGMPLEVIVRVGEERKKDYRISDIWNYDAELSEVTNTPFVNPTEEEARQVQKGHRVIIEGKLIGYEKSREDELLAQGGFPEGSVIVGQSDHWHAGVSKSHATIRLPDGQEVEYNHFWGLIMDKTRATIELDDGRQVTVSMPTGKIKFSGGVLENYDRRDKMPLAGDMVRIAANVKAGAQFEADWCDPCYLVEPSEQRLHNYSQLRHDVISRVEQVADLIGSGQYASARKIIGETRTLEITNEELENLNSQVARIPEAERPVHSTSENYNETKRSFHIQEIDDAFEVCIEGMTKAEFIEFTSNATSGRLKQNGKNADTSYLYFISDDFGVDENTREQMMYDCIEQRLINLSGMPYDHDVHWDDKYNIDQTFSYLGNMPSERTTQMLIDSIVGFVENGEYDKQGDQPPKPESFVNSAVYALLNNIADRPSNVLMGNLKALENALGILETTGDESSAVSNLQQIRTYIKDRVGEF